MVAHGTCYNFMKHIENSVPYNTPFFERGSDNICEKLQRMVAHGTLSKVRLSRARPPPATICRVRASDPALWQPGLLCTLSAPEALALRSASHLWPWAGLSQICSRL